MRRLAVALANVAPAHLARVARAHDFWIEPSTWRPAAGALVSVGLRVGEGFQGDAVPRKNTRIERFVLVTSAGETAIVGLDGAEPAGSVRVPAEGIHVIGYRSKPAAITLEAAKFEAYLKEEGLDHVIAWRKEKGESERAGKEVYSRCAKAILAAGKAPKEGFDRVLGFSLELVPVADPRLTAPGAKCPVRLLHGGKPLAGVLVVAMRKGAPAARREARTDAEGRVSLPLDAAGTWLVKAVHMVRTPAGTEADWESLWASLTFEVPEKARAGE
jgi:uncharacterized GH25 family protein